MSRSSLLSALPPDSLTHVKLTWIEKQIETWIRFGREEREQILNRRQRILSFRPGTIFALIRWLGDDYGTVASHMAIVRAVAPGEAYQTLPRVRPGGDLLLKVIGWPKVQRVLFLIDAVEDLGLDAATVAPDYWRHAHNRLAAGDAPRLYTAARHQAFLLRRRVGA